MDRWKSGAEQVSAPGLSWGRVNPGIRGSKVRYVKMGAERCRIVEDNATIAIPWCVRWWIVESNPVLSVSFRNRVPALRVGTEIPDG